MSNSNEATALPVTVLIRIISFFDGGDEYLPTFISLQRTCKAIHNTMKGWNDSVENIVLRFLGGADVIRALISALIRENMYEPLLFYFRGDSIDYLTLAVQNHVVNKLKKSLAVANHRWRMGDPYPPEVNVSDLHLVDMMRDDAPFLGSEADKIVGRFGPGADSYMEVEGADISIDTSHRLARALAYQVGILKINDGAFPMIWQEVLLCMAAMVFGVVSSIELSGRGIWQGMSPEEYEGLWKYGDVRMMYSPPYEETELGPRKKIIIVPGQVKAAAVRRGIKPPLGFEELGCDGWATGNGRTRKEEITEAINQYKRSNLFDVEDDEIMNDSSESDGDFFGGSDTESEGSHELDSSFEDN